MLLSSPCESIFTSTPVSDSIRSISRAAGAGTRLRWRRMDRYGSHQSGSGGGVDLSPQQQYQQPVYQPQYQQQPYGQHWQ